MAEKFRMIVARGMYNQVAILSVPVEFADRISKIIDDVELWEALHDSGESLPELPGVYLLDVTLMTESCGAVSGEAMFHELTDDIDWIIITKTTPLLTKDKDLFHRGFAHVSIDPHKCPISTHQEIMERAKNTPAKDVAKAMLENLNLTTEQISELKEEHAQTIKTILELYEIPFNKLLDIFKKPKVNGTIPLMDPPPNKYPTKTAGEWVEHKTEENYIYTIGYGNRTPEQVTAILKENNIQLVFDVRRIGSKGRLRAYDHGKNFRTFLAGHDIEYGQIRNQACCIGNHHDSLDEYKQNIKTGVMRSLAENIISYGRTTCFLCCELHAYKDDKQNCHRVHVADAVAKELRRLTGEPWGIEHL